MSDESAEKEGGNRSYCKHCGGKVPEDARYCPRCGAQVTETEWVEYEVSSESLVRRIKELIKEGNVRRIVVRSERDETLLEIPVTVGVVGILLAPYLAALGTIAALVTKCTIAVEKRRENSSE
ncbi:MAG: DUF4342 domain-containing protein [Candidatus Bathyarchaeia archaeon]